MLLKTTKLQYNENGAFITIEAPNLISCDVNYVNSQSRETQGREGVFTNQTIDALEVVFKRGVYTLLDGSKPGDVIPLKYNNGAISIQGPFAVGLKNNKKDSETGITYTYISFSTTPDGEYIIAARGGEGGHVDDVEVDGISVVHDGVAEIELAAYAKKSEIEKEYVKSATSITTGQKVYVREAGTDKTINYGSGVDLGSGTLVLRATNAQIKVPDAPAADGDATSKKYVDTKLADKITKDPSSADFKIGYDAGGIYIIK